MIARREAPPWLPPVAFGFLLSGLMTLIVSGVSTAHAVGVAAVAARPGRFVEMWLSAYVFSWAVAFPTVLLIGPAVRAFVGRRFPTSKREPT